MCFQRSPTGDIPLYTDTLKLILDELYLLKMPLNFSGEFKISFTQLYMQKLSNDNII